MIKIVKKQENISFKNSVIIFISTLVIILSLFLNINASSTFKYVFLLPFFHGTLMLIFSLMRRPLFKYPVQIIVYIGLFIRNVVTPLLLSGSYSIQKINVINQDTVNIAIFLMLYETLVIFIILSCNFTKKKYLFKRYTRFIVGSNKNVFTYIFGLLLLLLLVLWFLVPEISKRYTSIFDLKTIFNIASNVNKENLSNSSRGLFTIGTMLFNICRFFLSTIALFEIRKKSDKKIVGIFAILVVFFINLFFVSTEIAVIFFIAIYLYLITIKLWPETENILMLFFFVVGVLGIFFLGFAKSGLNSVDEFIKSIGTILQAYFPGLINMCGVITIPREEVLNIFFADLYTIIPFRNLIFGIQVINLSDLFNLYNGIEGQIVPFLGETYYYFGIIFAPLLTACLIYFSIKISIKMEVCKDIIRYSVYCLSIIYLSIGTVCYNMILVGQTFTALIIPLYILSMFSHDKFFLIGGYDDKNKTASRT